MDVMEMRRRLMAAARPSVIDTSPRIAEFNKRLNAGNPATKPPVDYEGACITDYYDYPAQTTTQTICMSGKMDIIQSYLMIFQDGTYKDYWGQPNDGASKACINGNSNQIKFTLDMSKLDDSYAYIVGTGQILFAGRNTQYYGHTNVSEIA